MLEKRKCPKCEHLFTPIRCNQKWCSFKCRTVYDNPKPKVDVVTGTLGAAAELAVSYELLMNGWHVFRALSPSSFCDLVAFKNGVTRFIEVRSGSLLRGMIGAPVIYNKKHRSGTTEFAVYVRQDKTIHYIPI